MFVGVSGKIDYVRQINNPAKIWSGSYQRWRPHVAVKYRGRVPFIIIFSFLATRTAHTRVPIFTHDSSKDAVWRKGVPFFGILTFWRSFSPRTPQILPAKGKSQPKWKGRMTSKRLKIGKIYQQRMNINLGNPFRIRHWKLRTAPLAEKSPWRHFRFARKHHYLGNDAC